MQNFKAGDWVIHNGQFKKVKSCGGYAVIFDDLRESYCHQDSCVLWQPKPGEWCWFWNEYFDVPILAKLISIDSVFGRPLEYKVKTPSCISEISYNYMSNMSFKKCEPFIGQLPSFLKDNT